MGDEEEDKRLEKISYLGFYYYEKFRKDPERVAKRNAVNQEYYWNNVAKKKAYDAQRWKKIRADHVAYTKNRERLQTWRKENPGYRPPNSRENTRRYMTKKRAFYTTDENNKTKPLLKDGFPEASFCVSLE